MSVGEEWFLGMVAASLSIFGVVLAYASWVASGSSAKKAAPRETPQGLIPSNLGVPIPH